MASPGPPPYTLAQITAMTSPEERTRARAELESYIARMKKINEDRAAAKAAYETYQSNGYSAHVYTGPSDAGARNTFGNFDITPPGRFSTFHRHAPGPKRGGYAYGGGGYGSYHPYQRPHHAQKFKNRTAIFNKSDATTGSTEPNETETQSPEAAHKTLLRQSDQQQTEPQTLCPAFTSTGICSRHGCPHLHDPNKQAVCKRWLYKDDCLKGEFCPLSHTASPHNAPTCLHFQGDRCTHDDCRFAHIRVNPAAPNCEAFGRLGYCEKGESCTNLHAHECPSFSNTGACPAGDKCRLGHVHRASRMRTTTRPSSMDRSTSPDSPEETSDSTEEDMDTAGDTEEWTIGPRNGSAHSLHQFAQQADFVPLDADD